MRALPLFSALALAPLAFAQAPTGPHEYEIWEAYQNLRASDTLKFEMVGADGLGRAVEPVHAVLYWRLSNDPRTGGKTRAQVELDIYERDRRGEERIATRIVGDGTVLYRYDIGRQEVSTTTYGFYGNVVPSPYEESDAPKLLRQLRAVTPGPASYLVRLLSEVFPAGDRWTAKFNSWDPGIVAHDFNQAWALTPSNATTASGRTKKQTAGITNADILYDPLDDEPYLRGDPTRSRWFFYRVDQDRPLQTMAVHMRDDRATDEDPPYWVLDSWHLVKTMPGRVLNLTLTARPETAPEGAFVPYLGDVGRAFRPVVRGQ